MDGRVKTLHPKVHGGILGRRGQDDGGDGAARHRADRPGGGEPLSLRADRRASPTATLPTAIENIDIGGPTMVRAAAKNHRDVAIVVDAGDYARVLAELRDSTAARGSPRASTWRSRPSSTPRATTARSPITSAACTGDGRATRLPAHLQPAVRARRRSCATARTRTRTRRSTSSTAPARPASPPRASCRARSSPTTTSPTPTPRWSA